MDYPMDSDIDFRFTDNRLTLLDSEITSGQTQSDHRLSLPDSGITSGQTPSDHGLSLPDSEITSGQTQSDHGLSLPDSGITSGQTQSDNGLGLPDSGITSGPTQSDNGHASPDKVATTNCRTRQCNKPIGHSGTHNKKRKYYFQKCSPILAKHQLSGYIAELNTEIRHAKQEKSTLDISHQSLTEQKSILEEEKSELEIVVAKLNSEYEKFKVITDQRNNSKAQRARNATSDETASSTRNRRSRETSNMLDYIH